MKMFNVGKLYIFVAESLNFNYNTLVLTYLCIVGFICTQTGVIRTGIS